MRNLLLVSMLCLAALGPAHAAPASSESIETLLAVTKSEALTDSVYAQVEQSMRLAMRQGAAGKTLTEEQQQIVDQMSGKLVALMRSELNWTKLKPHYVQLYSENFEQDEIDELIAFYRSKAGQAFVTKMPLVMQKSMDIATTQLQILIPKIRQLVEQAKKDAKLMK